MIALPTCSVLDVETTGFGNADRIVEIAIATVDLGAMTVLEEYDTLVNPLRDVSAEVSEVHGLTPSDLEAAPSFAEIATAVGRRINGSIIVAHNASFDVRMLVNEFKRADVPFNPGSPFCTCIAMGRMSLKAACAAHGILIPRHHRALADVKATAGLFMAMIRNRRGERAFADNEVARCDVQGREIIIRTLRREALGRGDAMKRTTRSPWKDPRLQYRYALNAAMDDNRLSQDERNELNALGDMLGLTRSERIAQHLTIYRRALDAAHRDQYVSKGESGYLATLASALGLDPSMVPMQSGTETQGGWPEGTNVCFTGSGGEMLARSEMTAIATRIGHIAVPSVTKRLNLLVAAHPSSQSSKTVKARRYGIDIADAGSYLAEAYGILDDA